MKKSVYLFMVIIFRILIIGLISLVIGSLIRVIIVGLISRRRIAKMEKMRNFLSDTVTWAKEISDLNIKSEYLRFCMDNLKKVSKSVDGAVKFDIDSYRKEIIRKYSNHIPSLKQEVRDMKLKQILG